MRVFFLFLVVFLASSSWASPSISPIGKNDEAKTDAEAKSDSEVLASETLAQNGAANEPLEEQEEQEEIAGAESQVHYTVAEDMETAATGYGHGHGGHHHESGHHMKHGHKGHKSHHDKKGHKGHHFDKYGKHHKSGHHDHHKKGHKSHHGHHKGH